MNHSEDKFKHNAEENYLFAQTQQRAKRVTRRKQQFTTLKHELLQTGGKNVTKYQPPPEISEGYILKVNRRKQQFTTLKHELLQTGGKNVTKYQPPPEISERSILKVYRRKQQFTTLKPELLQTEGKNVTRYQPPPEISERSILKVNRRKQQFTTLKPELLQSEDKNVTKYQPPPEIPEGYNILIWQPDDELQSNTNDEDTASQAEQDIESSEKIMSDTTNHIISTSSISYSDYMQIQPESIEDPDDSINHSPENANDDFVNIKEETDAKAEDENAYYDFVNIKEETDAKAEDENAYYDFVNIKEETDAKAEDETAYDDFVNIKEETDAKADDENAYDDFVNIKEEIYAKAEELNIKQEQYQLSEVEEEEQFINMQTTEEPFVIQDNCYAETNQDNNCYAENIQDNCFVETNQNNCLVKTNQDDDCYAETNQDNCDVETQDNCYAESYPIKEDSDEVAEGEFVLQFNDDDGDFEDSSNSSEIYSEEGSSSETSDNSDEDEAPENLRPHFLLGEQPDLPFSIKCYDKKINLFHSMTKNKDSKRKMRSRKTSKRKKGNKTIIITPPKKDEISKEPSEYICHLCFRDLHNVSYYIKHMKIVHGISSDGQPIQYHSSLQCFSCERTFLSVENCLRHRKLCEKLKELKCRQEAQKVMGASADVTEVRINNFPCHLCTAIHKTLKSLNEHINYRHTYKPNKLEAIKQVTSIEEIKKTNEIEIASKDKKSNKEISLQASKSSDTKFNKAFCHINPNLTTESTQCSQDNKLVYRTYSNPRKRLSEEMPIKKFTSTSKAGL